MWITCFMRLQIITWFAVSWKETKISGIISECKQTGKILSSKE